MVRADIYVRFLARKFLPYHICSEWCLLGTSELAVCGWMDWAEGYGISVAMTVNNILPRR
jgi:hypothetical protein